jgi:hypothetical protein
MTLSVQSSMIALGAEVYYDPQWHLVIESHLLYLSNSQAVVPLTIDPHDAFLYEQDLWSLLQKYNQQPQYFWPIMRVNGMYSPQEYRRDMTLLALPLTQTIDSLLNLYTTISARLV